MDVLACYRFKKGDPVPNWLYSVKDNGAKDPAACSFGTAGGAALLEGRQIAIWPDRARLPEEYLFYIEQFLSNATAEHPAGSAYLLAFSDEGTAKEQLGSALTTRGDPLPEVDPRN